MKQRIYSLKEKIRNLTEKSEANTENFNDKIKDMPPKQQLAVKACLKASERKNTCGMHYEKEWLLECIIMRMKSPRLYEHMRLNKIMVLPSRTCLQKSLKAYRGGFGFNKRMLPVLKEKVKELDSFSRHGNLLFDELKLSENLQVRSDGIIEGYVDYGENTIEESKSTICDHGLVLLFQPFIGDWVQIIGTFATHSNVKGNMLAKLLVDAIIYIEEAGLLVDAVTGDAASWNRAMWREFGVGVSKTGSITCKVNHPCDDTRSLHFISDFPHLLKCLRNAFLKSGFITPSGKVLKEFIVAAWKEDQQPLTLRAMPNIHRVHLFPNNFEKMKVNYAFQLFSDEVIKGLFLYENKLIEQYGDIQPTVSFIQKINYLIEIMTSRSSVNALQPNSAKTKILIDFLEYISA